MFTVTRKSALTSKEAEAILEIAGECGLSEWSHSDYLTEPARENSIFLAACSDYRIIGFLCVRVTQSEADLLNFGVLKSCRRAGIGGQLFEALREILSEYEKMELWLEVRKSNYAAIRFYTRRGFSHVQNRRNFYTEPVEDASVLKLVF